MAAAVVALLLPLEAGAAAERTALVATAGLLVRQMEDELSMPGWIAEAAGAVGAVAGGGCGMPTDNEAGGAERLEAECGRSGLSIGGWPRLIGGGGVRRGAADKGCIPTIMDDGGGTGPNPFDILVNGGPIRLLSGRPDDGGVWWGICWCCCDCDWECSDGGCE